MRLNSLGLILAGVGCFFVAASWDGAPWQFWLALLCGSFAIWVGVHGSHD